ncbi:tail fiber domain-containing protein [Microcystis aeruginosa CS-563/04]|uniref:tail fiber domain-containing protein n=1 Tax=Microcystis aeruginosa TaxID=1126 RepID=UPI00232F79CD|nr:tail fiber domain-containing protein [Microcystis aeruginosa]MDB9421813.1 tail fiber domain-containing protein [Microcystis aeruginosa CS-563/04]
MLTRVPEEIRLAEKALDFADFASQEPLKFQFYYEQNGKAEISNTIYLEDGNTSLTLYLEVFNDSEDVITFQKPNSVGGRLATVQAGGNQAASAKKCHFQLRWENDLGLKPNEIEMEAGEQWQVNYDYDDDGRFFSIYFLHKSGLELKPSEKIKLGFLNLTANNRTVKSSNVELLYGGKGLVLQGQSQEAIEDEISSRIAVSVINYPGKAKIPLQFRVLGSNKILNDGTTTNSLTLKILNSPLSSNARPILLLDKNSRFIVSFETGSHTDALVATTDQSNNVNIAVTEPNSWQSDHQPNSTGWSFTPKDHIKKLNAGEGVELRITNLVTSSASGFACIYIDYQNIGSYPDGRLVIPIEKTPLLYSGDTVAVGTKNFDAKLTVAGPVVLGKSLRNTKFLIYPRISEGGDFLHITSDTPITNNDEWDWAQGIFLKRGGNVGIGTSRPQAKLHVNGGDAVISGKVGIGTNSPAAKLHVDGGDAVISGKVGIGIGNNTPKIHLAIGDDDTGLQQQGDDELAIYTNNSERVRVTRHGTVYIGPSADFLSYDRLVIRTNDIQGLGGTLRLLGKGQYAEGAKLNFGSQNVVYLTEDEEKKLLIHADTRITLDSPKVGIGTKDPKAKLHVEGGDALITGGSLSFGQPGVQLINLWKNESGIGVHGIGVQSSTTYFRSSNHFAWYKGGEHNDAILNPGKGGTALMVIKSDGNVGIGTTTPTKGKVHIEGFVNYQHPDGYRYMTRDTVYHTGSYPGTYSLYTSDKILAKEFNAFSDERIKEIYNRSDSQEDLKTLLQIEITDYSYRDKIAKGNGKQKKVIGQQIAKVFPQAVSTNTDVVCDIFQFATLSDGWVTLTNHGLKTGERVKLIWGEDKSEIFTIEAVTPDTFQIDLDYCGDILVYGREVNDFHVVDYDALSMLHISATQALYKIISRLQQEVETLKQQSVLSVL